jgi:hypothetical protein
VGATSGGGRSRGATRRFRSEHNFAHFCSFVWFFFYFCPNLVFTGLKLVLLWAQVLGLVDGSKAQLGCHVLNLEVFSQKRLQNLFRSFPSSQLEECKSQSQCIRNPRRLIGRGKFQTAADVEWAPLSGGGKTQRGYQTFQEQTPNVSSLLFQSSRCFHQKREHRYDPIGGSRKWFTSSSISFRSSSFRRHIPLNSVLVVRPFLEGVGRADSCVRVTASLEDALLMTAGLSVC